MTSPNTILLIALTLITVACSQEPKASDSSTTKKSKDSPVRVTENSGKTVITIDEEKAKKLKEERAKQQGEMTFTENDADANVKEKKSRLSKDSPMTISTENGRLL